MEKTIRPRSRQRLTLSVWLYVLICVSAGVLFYLRSTPNIPMEDNLFFSFMKFDIEDVTCDYEPVPISGLDDIVVSLHKMYNGSNGRVPVHFFVMLFMGIIGVETFYVVNSLVFVAVAYLASVFIFSRRGLTPFRLLVTVLMLLYCMPQTATLWYCPAYGINYMWSLGATLLFLLLWRSKRKRQWWQIVMLCPLCYLLGWTHEAFVVPVSCMLVVMYATGRRSVKSRSALMALAYVAGTVTLVCAPAILLRTEGNVGHYPGLLSWTANAVTGLLSNIPFDLAVVALAWMFFKHRDDCKRCCRDWLPLLLIIFFAAGMSLVLVMGFSRGSLALSFFCMTVVLRVCCIYIRWRVLAYVTAVVLVLFVVHQSAIVVEARRHYRHYRAMIESFLVSPSGTVVYSPLKVANPLTSPWVEPWKLDIADGDVFDKAIEMGISFYYHHPWHKPLKVISPEEASALQSGTLFTPDNKIAGSGEFYTVEGIDHLLRRADDDSVATGSYVVRYDVAGSVSGLSWRKRLKARLYGLPESEPLTIGEFSYGGHRYVAGAKESTLRVASVDRE